MEWSKWISSQDYNKAVREGHWKSSEKATICGTQQRLLEGGVFFISIPFPCHVKRGCLSAVLASGHVFVSSPIVFLSLGPLWSLTGHVCVCEYVCVIIYILTTALIYLPPAQEHWGFPGALVVKNPPANVGDVRDAGSISGCERSPGGGHGHSLQYSCLENSMDRGARWTTAYRVTKNHTLLSD